MDKAKEAEAHKAKIRRVVAEAERHIAMLPLTAFLISLSQQPDSAGEHEKKLKLDAALAAFEQGFKLTWDLLGEPR